MMKPDPYNEIEITVSDGEVIMRFVEKHLPPGFGFNYRNAGLDIKRRNRGWSHAWQA